LWHAVITQEAYNLFFFGKTCQTHDHYSTTRQSHIGYIYTYQFFICSSILPISVQQVTEAIRSLTLWQYTSSGHERVVPDAAEASLTRRRRGVVCYDDCVWHHHRLIASMPLLLIQPSVVVRRRGRKRVSARSLAASAWLLLRTLFFSVAALHAFFALLPKDYYQQTHTSRIDNEW
jgi:hypothetical protein